MKKPTLRETNLESIPEEIKVEKKTDKLISNFSHISSI